MAKAAQIAQSRRAAPAAPAAAPQRAARPPKAPAPPPSPTQLLADAYDALRLCEDGMAAYSTLQNMMAGDKPGAQTGVPAPRFAWEAAPPGGTPRQIVSNLAKLPPEDRPAVLGPLVNLHFDQMLAGAEKAKAMVDRLVAILTASAQAAAPADEEAGDDQPEDDQPVEDGDDMEAADEDQDDQDDDEETDDDQQGG